MMKRMLLTVVVATAVLPAGLSLGQVPGGPPPLDPRVIVWDKGPAKIDVSKYPPEIKGEYKVFSEVCGRCHTLARAVNCDFATEDDWERYIKRMMRRAGGLLPPADAERVFNFAVYDSKIRKKDLYARKMRDAGK